MWRDDLMHEQLSKTVVDGSYGFYVRLFALFLSSNWFHSKGIVDCLVCVSPMLYALFSIINTQQKMG